MARKTKVGARRRGRPRKLHARREGRRTGIDPVDKGTAPLRQRKLRATGRTDLPLDGVAVLLGHDHLDRQQFDTLGEITR